MINIRRGIAVLGCVMAAALTPAAAAAQSKDAPSKEPPLSAFFGTFTGKGITKASAAQYYGLRNRDLNVVITDDGAGGFRLTWTTIRRRTAGIKRGTTMMNFKPVAAPKDAARLWRAEENGDVLLGKPFAWARIQRRALIVYVMGIDRVSGRMSLSIYSRRLAPSGLFLQYRRVREGRSVRLVEALLKRAK